MGFKILGNYLKIVSAGAAGGVSPRGGSKLDNGLECGIITM